MRVCYRGTSRAGVGAARASWWKAFSGGADAKPSVRGAAYKSVRRAYYGYQRKYFWPRAVL